MSEHKSEEKQKKADSAQEVKPVEKAQAHAGKDLGEKMNEPKDMAAAKPTKSKSPVKMLVIGFIIVIIFVLIGLGMFLKSQVRQGSQTPFVIQTTKLFGISAAAIDNEVFPYDEYLAHFNGLKKLAQGNPDAFAMQYGSADDDTIRDIILSQQLVNRKIHSLADVFDVSVTEEELNTQKEAALAQVGGIEAANTELEELYGWTFDQYVDRVLRPGILEQKIVEAFMTGESEQAQTYTREERRARHILFKVDPEATEEERTAIREKAEGVLQRIRDGEDFAAMAEQFGEDGTKDIGGDLDWFGPGVMVAPFEDAVFSTKVGELHDGLVESDFGYHIVRVDDRRRVPDFKYYLDNVLLDARVRVSVSESNPFERIKNDILLAMDRREEIDAMVTEDGYTTDLVAEMYPEPEFTPVGVDLEPMDQ
ncbi:peptidylprolyl isomerase [Candidatus Nomurabacteria bacterium]|nr:peptidylprolyl isomerase [Candidatus Nomurabacteria bacterium]